MRTFVAIIFLLIGLLFLGVELLAILDPVGSQMANDNDPFGEPPGLDAHIFMAVLSGICLFLAYRLFGRKHSP